MFAGDRMAPMLATDLAEWEELYRLDPWGPERSDLAMGLLCSLLDSCHRTRGQTPAPSEFMPYLGRLLGPEPDQDIDDMKAAFAAFAED